MYFPYKLYSTTCNLSKKPTKRISTIEGHRIAQLSIWKIYFENVAKYAYR